MYTVTRFNFSWAKATDYSEEYDDLLSAVRAGIGYIGGFSAPNNSECVLVHVDDSNYPDAEIPTAWAKLVIRDDGTPGYEYGIPPLDGREEYYSRLGKRKE